MTKCTQQMFFTLKIAQIISKISKIEYTYTKKLPNNMNIGKILA